MTNQTSQAEWLDLKALQQHACVSERTLHTGLAQRTCVEKH